MAKSLRSKSRRKNNATKRVLYGEREIDQLMRTLGLTKEAEKIRREEIMRDWTEISAAIKAAENGEGSDAPMDTNIVPKDTRLRSSHPAWKSQRKIKAAKKNAKKGKKNKKAPKKIANTKIGKNKK